MTVEVAIVIIISVAIILVLLFYMVTRYFNYRLQRSIEKQNCEYSLVEGIQLRRDQIEQADSEHFADKVYDQWNNNKKQQGHHMVFLQLAEISGNNRLRQSLNTDDTTIYGHSRAFRKQFSSIPIMQQSFRSNPSIKSFNIQKLDSFRSMNTENSSPTIQQKQTIHKFVSQIVSYTKAGISIVYNLVTQVWKPAQNQAVKEKRKIEKEFISRNDDNFLQTLEAYGFDYETQSAFKFEKILKLPHMKYSITYSTSQLKSTQGKQEITLEQFYQLKKQLALQ